MRKSSLAIINMPFYNNPMFLKFEEVYIGRTQLPATEVHYLIQDFPILPSAEYAMAIFHDEKRKR